MSDDANFFAGMFLGVLLGIVLSVITHEAVNRSWRNALVDNPDSIVLETEKEVLRRKLAAMNGG